MTRTVPSPAATPGAAPEHLSSYDVPVEEPMDWLRAHATAVRAEVRTGGAVLLRGLPLRDATDLAAVRDALEIGAHVPREAFALREDHGDGIVSPIPWPEDLALCARQESVFSHHPPALVLTACVAASRAQQPSAGCRHAAGARADSLRPWPSGCGPTAGPCGAPSTRASGSPGARPSRSPTGTSLEALLEGEDIDHVWLPGGMLRTSRRLPAVIAHPATDEQCWFNDLVFLNAGSLDPRERDVLVRAFGADLPVDTSFGDGSPVTPDESRRPACRLRGGHPNGPLAGRRPARGRQPLHCPGPLGPRRVTRLPGGARRRAGCRPGRTSTHHRSRRSKAMMQIDPGASLQEIKSQAGRRDRQDRGHRLRGDGLGAAQPRRARGHPEPARSDRRGRCGPGRDLGPVLLPRQQLPQAGPARGRRRTVEACGCTCGTPSRT
ncbi:hypothetical protein [Nocardioides convexus]|uniref:hypothetical protein n=1 Tax=Nocardioides convexus TaxID=2712224 RepID=UPI002418367C|nr:hypothetical protein [Nocardioides convexus]